MSAEGDRLRRRVHRVWLAVGVVVLGWAAWQFLGPVLAVVVPPLLLAVIIVYVLNPLVGALERVHVHRFLGTALGYLLLFSAVAVPAVMGLPLLWAQAASISEQAPDLLTQLTEQTEAWLAGQGFAVALEPPLDPEQLPALDSLVGSEDSRSALAAVVGGLSGLATGLVRVALVALLGPVIAFYVLVDLPRLRRWTVRHLPPRHRVEAVTVGRELSGVIGGYLRGQLLVALFVGTAVTIGMRIIDLPYWLLVGIVAGVTNLIPLLGPFSAGVVGGLIALFHGGPGFALLVIGVLLIVQQLDNHLISPLVMGQSVQLHPLAVLLALLVAGTLYGLPGLLVAVPFVAAARVLATHFWSTRVPWADDTSSPVVAADGRPVIPSRRSPMVPGPPAGVATAPRDDDTPRPAHEPTRPHAGP